jgi:hypothetical protein
MASSIESGVADFNPPPNPSPAFGDIGDLPASCFSYDPPAWADADQDGYPDVESTVTIDCVVSGTDGEWTIASVSTYSDLAPGLANFNYASVYDASVVFAGTILGDTPAENFEGTVEFFDIGTDIATEGGGSFAIEQARDTGADVSGPAGNRVYATREQTGWALSYTPGDVWSRGSALIPGAVTVSGVWEVDVRAGDYHQHSGSSVETVVPLQVVDELACPTHVVAGQIRATFAESDQTSLLDVTWLGCGNSVVNFTPPPTGVD